MDMKALEKALAYSKIVPDAIALTVLKDAVERFLGAQERVYPVTATPKKEPGNQDTAKWPDGLSDLVKRYRHSTVGKGCPACGCPDGIPHFCTGRSGSVYPGRMPNGIEYYLNQATATGAATNGQRVGGFGAGISGAEG